MSKQSKEGMGLADIAKSIPNLKTEIISTNIFVSDFILKGGLELGSSIQLVGESGVGKSTISLQLAKQICNQGKNVVYVDSEGSVTNELLKTIGLEDFMNNRFFLIKEPTFKKVDDYLCKFIATGEISMIIIDSLAGLVHEGFTNLKDSISSTTNNTSYNSKNLTQFISKFKSLATLNKFCLVMINQYRYSVNMMVGSQKKEYGSKVVRYSSDIIIKISNIKKHVDFKGMAKAFNGIELELEVIKSNKSAPEESIPFALHYGKGISNLINKIYALIKLKIIEQKGSYYQFKYNDKAVYEQGLANFYNKLIELDVDLSEHDDKINEYYKIINEIK
ncbi:MAG: AAA family ATPase [Ignavibacteriales bacterium]